MGDTVPARDTGSLTQIYQPADTRSGHNPAGFLAGFTAALLAGSVFPLGTRPRWRRPRQERFLRRDGGQCRLGTERC
ncbi:hypothetical protein AB0J83_48250 [Actinoplanes sp. NPDC049596]|uniref:hypothetical protein n=1 Tax=unclassified Actinoplanes TaxID=2626549 RepID=UPI003423D157